MAGTVNYETALAEAFAAGEAAKRTPEAGSGCGRIYACVLSKEHARGMTAAAKKLGRIFQRKGHRGMTNVLYVGYDNGRGDALAAGTAVVRVLKAHGILCYRDEQED